MKSEKDYLSDQPNDILLEISQFRASDMLNLRKVSKRFSFFKQRPTYQLAVTELQQLLSHSALGEWDKAHEIWSKDPALLSHRGTVYHPNCTYEGQVPVEIPIGNNPGRYKYVNRTAWQIAWMNEEYEIAEEMGKFIDEDEKKMQFAEIFPDGKLVKHDWSLEEAKKRLQAVFAEIIKDTSIDQNNLDSMSVSTRKALNALYDYVKPAPEHSTGLVFDANIYMHALELYEKKYAQFRTGEQRSFWCIRIEEYFASLLGTGYLRPHAQGTLSKLSRTGCILVDNSPYFGFRRSSDSLPGLHFFVGLYGRCESMTDRGIGLGETCSSFSKLISSKNESKNRAYAVIFESADHQHASISHITSHQMRG